MVAFPQFTPEEISEAMEGLTAAERQELYRLMSNSDLPWTALPGPQAEAMYSTADVVGYGGAAGGGKTDLACGLATTAHERSIIYRRESAQLTGVYDRIAEIVGSRVGFNSQAKVWRLRGGRRQIEFGGFPNLGDEERYQGRPHDLVVFDEATQMLEKQVRYLLGWLRSTKKVRQKALLTFNPPTSPEGRWIIQFFAPWLDKRHALYPTRPGQLRWVTTIKGEDVWVPDGRPFVFAGSSLRDPTGTGERVYDLDPKDYRGARKVLVQKPQSRTFIPAKVTDNPFLMETDYMSRLQALPEPLRSQMLYGDFEAGMEDHEWQVIPTAWVKAAMDRWVARGGAKASPGQMDSMGVDVAQGGRDRFVIACRHGSWFPDLIVYPGRAVTSGAIGAGLVIKHRRDRAPVHVDVIGWGSDTFGALQGNGIHSLAVNVAEGSPEVTESGQQYANKRAELWWKLREALDPDGQDPLCLPDDTKLEVELTAPRWIPGRRGILIESKEDIKKRIGVSTDKADAVCLALISTMKREAIADQVSDGLYGNDDYDRGDL